MGENAGVEEQSILDNILPELIRKNSGSKSRVHLIYSKDEHTYPEHIKAMCSDFDKNNIRHIDTVEKFTEHGEIAKVFPPWIKLHIPEVVKS